MNENRRQILEMLAAGKITADEAERLLAALDIDTAKPVGELRAMLAAVRSPRQRAHAPNTCGCWWRRMKR